ncbi:MAG: transglutaminase-like domain-containing protein, partial [Bacteroidota bacterium]|nr:transglutaminase-like domain-containing protein [Bacteroidota bacterium]
GDALEVEFYRKGFTYALLQSEDDRYIPPMRGHYYDIVEFWSSVPLLSKVYTVNVPKEKQLQFKFYNGECTSSVEFKNDRALYTFKAKNIMPMEQEPRQVALSDVAPKLLISTSPDWKAKSLWFHKVNEDFGSFEATPEVKAQTELILKGAVSEQDSIARLTHWVADNIRYSGISMGPGEGYTLHKGAMTFLDRCGVCKDKAGMLITMLRAAGFESYPAMTMAGSRIDYIPADQFNHSVTVVKHRNGNYEMLDPTWVPFLRELWSSAEQQQNYLMGVPEGADLLVTPVSAPENHYYRISGTSTLKKDGSLEGEMEVTAEGQSDAALRRFFTGSFKTDWKTNIEKELLRVAPKAILEELDYGSDPYNYMAGPIKIRMKYRIPEFAIVTGKEIICNPFIAARMFHNQQGQLAFNIGLKERKYPFTDRCSRLVELNETVNLPEDFSLEGKAVREESNGSGASAKGSLEQKETRLVLNYEGKYFKRVYAAEDWNSFKNAVEIQNKLTETPIVLLSR